MPKEKTDKTDIGKVADDRHDSSVEEMDYDAAFDEAAEGEVVAKTTDDDPAGKTGEPDDKKEGSETPPTSDDDPPKGDKEDPPKPDDKETPAPARSKEDQKLIDQLESKTAELEGQLAEKAKPADDPAKQEPAKPAALSDEDKAVLDEVAEDWPTVTRALQIQVGQLEQKLSGLIEQKFKAVQEIIKPIAQTTQLTSQERFEATIKEKHPDAFSLLSEVETWIESQPDYLQPGMNKVLDGGNAKQVITLLDQFKAATGKGEKPDDKGGDPPDPEKEKGDARRLAGLESVRTERTGIHAKDDPTDFDGAFDEAASQ